MSFISNLSMQVDMTCISEQLSDTINLNVGKVEMEILMLQNDIQLKGNRGSWSWSPKCKSLYTAVSKVASLFSSTNLGKSSLRLYEFQYKQTKLA